MVHNCHCGGRLRRTDIIEDGIIDGIQMYKDADTKVAHWICVKCYNPFKQRKRQSKKEVSKNDSLSKM